MRIQVPSLLPQFQAQQADLRADRLVLASMRRTDKETRRAIAQSREMIADTLKLLAETNARLRS
jgi:hypothetical protein